MKTLRLSLAFLLSIICSPAMVGANDADTSMCVRLFDFKSQQNAGDQWQSVNDNVMGGRSAGRFVINNGYLTFSGSINTNGGGFASIRHTVPTLPFIEASYIRLSVRSDGRPYTLSLADEFSVRSGISHRAGLNALASNVLTEIDVSVGDLKPMFRGRQVQAPRLDTSAIQEIRIMLSDSVDGDFILDVAWVDVCR